MESKLKNNEIIKLDVGGKKFKTFRSTLLNVPNSLLGRMFSPDQHFNIKNDRDEKGWYFFDRNPSYFKHVLEYYRNGVLPYNPTDALIHEFSYWGIELCIEEEKEIVEKLIERKLSFLNPSDVLKRGELFVTHCVGEPIEEKCQLTGLKVKLTNKETPIDDTLEIHIGLMPFDTCDIEDKKKWATLGFFNASDIKRGKASTRYLDHKHIESKKWSPCITLMNGKINKGDLTITVKFIERRRTIIRNVIAQ
jgi:hypothetical protein